MLRCAVCCCVLPVVLQCVTRCVEARSVLQCVAVGTSVWPVLNISIILLCCSVFSCVTMCYRVSQGVARRCNVLECVAVCCSVL